MIKDFKLIAYSKSVANIIMQKQGNSLVKKLILKFND